MSRSEEQAARNEVLFREANEGIHAARVGMSIEGRTPYVCECEEERCTELVLLTVEEYARARERPERFLLVNGHAFTNGKVVVREDRYCLVEKQGRGGEIARGEA